MFMPLWALNFNVYRNPTVKLTDRPVARGLKLGSDTRVGNGCRNIKHVH